MKLKSALTLLVFFVGTTFSQDIRQPPTISVSGSAQVKVQPDEIYLRLGVETRDDRLDQAKKENDERIAKALAFLKTSHVKTKDIQTDYISAEPMYEGSSRTKPVAFLVRKSVEVKLTNIVAFESLLTGLLTNGVNYIHGIDFRTSELRKHRDAARAMAIRAAKEKAETLASDAGVKCGKVCSINANDWGGYYAHGGYWGGGFSQMSQSSVQVAPGGAESAEDSFSLGQISISASVNVSFLIE